VALVQQVMAKSSAMTVQSDIRLFIGPPLSGVSDP
jgi:hypothetical protein